MSTSQFYQDAKALRPELLNYNFRPAGHMAPPAQREYKEPNWILERIFEAWTNHLYRYNRNGKVLSHPDSYEHALELTKNIKPSVPEIHGFVLAHRHHRDIKDAGYFVSAIYNQSDEREIIWDFDIELNYLGYKLPADKLLINYGETGEHLGCEASGSVINYGKTGIRMGANLEGLVINCGEAGEEMGLFDQGQIINYGKAESMPEEAGDYIICIKDPESFFGITGFTDIVRELVLKEADCRQIPELIQYFDELKVLLDAGKNDYRALTAIPSADKMKADIENILRRARKLA